MASVIAPPSHLDTHAAAYNRDCHCRTFTPETLAQELAHDPALRDALAQRPHLFSALPVFIAPEDVARMDAVMAAVERVVALPAYRDAVLAWAPPAARHVPRALGVFLGYDFHLGPRGPQLIEINTNAGGALVNAVLARAQRVLCMGAKAVSDTNELEQRYFGMFVREWCLERGETPLRTVAIVDDAPATQYLYPEFLLFRHLFAQMGVRAFVVDPAALEERQDGLYVEGERIDLVYNRLTDFALAEPAHAHLRTAYLTDKVVLTPHPYAHALYADKRNLTLLTNADLLRAWSIDEATIDVLTSGIPMTIRVDPQDRERLWAERRRWFFKPAGGYGSKAAYRGDKLTTRVFAEIFESEYVAQQLVPPSERYIDVEAALKVDLRHYVYGREVLLRAARLYQGQTTNFRTLGGGFAPLFYPGPEACTCPPV